MKEMWTFDLKSFSLHRCAFDCSEYLNTHCVNAYRKLKAGPYNDFLIAEEE